jgi:hypothetical protein
MYVIVTNNVVEFKLSNLLCMSIKDRAKLCMNRSNIEVISIRRFKLEEFKLKI